MKKPPLTYIYNPTYVILHAKSLIAAPVTAFSVRVYPRVLFNTYILAGSSLDKKKTGSESLNLVLIRDTPFQYHQVLSCWSLS